MKRNYRLKDIAEAAGVSVMSVSKAINGKDGLSDETRKRILDIAEELNYTPNTIARSLHNGQTKTIGVVLSDSSEMVTAKILRAIHDRCRKDKYSVILANTDHEEAQEREAIDTLLSKQIDGLILVAPLLNKEEDLVSLKATGIPFVLLMRKNDAANIDTVINDNLLGGYQLVEHLIKTGRKSFLFVLIKDSQTCSERLDGYLRALEDYGIPKANYAIIESRPYIEDASTAMYEYLKKGALKYDAIVCGCDLQAVGVMDTVLNAGYNIPEDVALTGYDGIDLSQYLRVSLTTVVQPFYDIGYEGCEILLDRIKCPDIPVRKMVLKSHLEIRASSNRYRGRKQH